MLTRMIAFALAAVAVPLAASGQTETVTYFHTDAIGSVRMITDANQQELARYDFVPFGADWPGTSFSNAQNELKFGGKERDPETSATAAGVLDYFGARHYQSLTGRFTTVDPVMDIDGALVDPQRWSRYTYGLNNPLKFADPDGRNPVVVTGGIGAVVYAAWNAYANVRQGRAWYQNIGIEAGKGFALGAGFGLVGPAAAGVRLSAAVISGGTAGGTVWGAIRATQPVWEGSVIPRSFELSTAAGRVWVHGNATRHLERF